MTSAGSQGAPWDTTPTTKARAVRTWRLAYFFCDRQSGARVGISDETLSLEWNGESKGKGYSKIRATVQPATTNHRAAYRRFVGVIPPAATDRPGGSCAPTPGKRKKARVLLRYTNVPRRKGVGDVDDQSARWNRGAELANRRKIQSHRAEECESRDGTFQLECP